MEDLCGLMVNDYNDNKCNNNFFIFLFFLVSVKSVLVFTLSWTYMNGKIKNQKLQIKNQKLSDPREKERIRS